MKLIEFIIWIGELVTRLTMLTVSGSLIVLGVLYIIAFWGAVLHREITLNDLKLYYFGLLFLLTALCVLANLLLTKIEYTEGVGKEDDCDTCGNAFINLEDRHQMPAGVFCTRCWVFWQEQQAIKPALS